MASLRQLDLGAILAVAWLLVAVGLTVVFAPRLGLRGLGWLAMHHLLCVVGITHEFRQYTARQKARSSPHAPP